MKSMLGRNDAFFLPLVLLTIGAVMDATTTAYLASTYGTHGELNPFVRWGMESFGLWILPIGKLMTLGIVIVFVRAIKDQGDPWGMRWGPPIIAIGGVWWISLGIWHIAQLVMLT